MVASTLQVALWLSLSEKASTFSYAWWVDVTPKNQRSRSDRADTLITVHSPSTTYNLYGKKSRQNHATRVKNSNHQIHQMHPRSFLYEACVFFCFLELVRSRFFQTKMIHRPFGKRSSHSRSSPTTPPGLQFPLTLIVTRLSCPDGSLCPINHLGKQNQNSNKKQAHEKSKTLFHWRKHNEVINDWHAASKMISSPDAWQWPVAAVGG